MACVSVGQIDFLLSGLLKGLSESADFSSEEQMPAPISKGFMTVAGHRPSDGIEVWKRKA